MITLDPVTRRYHLGSRLWQWARIYQDRLQVLPTALPYFVRVRDALNETVQLAVLDHDDVIYVAKMESSRPLTLASSVGSRLPAYATGIGKAMLAALADETVQALYPAALARFTSHTAKTLAELTADLRETRRRGYALDRGEYSEDVRCVAIPILGEGNTLVAGLSVSVPQARFDPRFSQIAAECLADHGYALAQSLGASDPDAWRRGGA
jgi:IclR family acetate operon transcriptional repressor